MEFLKPELSDANPYKIEKHRYYELKHFCLQYPEWKKELDSQSYISSPSITEFSRYDIFKPVESIAERTERLHKNITLVEKAASLTDDILAPYVLRHVTQGLTYEKLNALCRIPCNREYYYRLYRRFFWILSMLKN